MMHNQTPFIFIVGIGWMGLHIAENFIEKDILFSGSVTTRKKAQELQRKDIDAYAVNLPESPFPETFRTSNIIIYTIPPKASQEVSEQMIRTVLENARQHAVKKAIYISSTSVYPEKNTTVREVDAEYISSRHTGVTMKRLEDLWVASEIRTTILRCGGLYGNDRIPGRFLENRPLSQPNKPVNMTHITDVISSINKIIEQNHFGDTFNVITINGMARKDFYKKYRNDLKIGGGQAEPYKIVSSQKIKEKLGIRIQGSSVTTTKFI